MAKSKSWKATSKMESKYKNDIYQRAKETFGVHGQIDMCIEEMAELTKELIKFKRGKGSEDSIAEEVADVSIMLEQMANIFDCHRTIVKTKKSKIIRLRDTIKKARGMENEKQIG